MAGCVGPCSGGLWTSLRMNCSGRDVYMGWFHLFREAVDKSQDELQWQRCLHGLVPPFQGSCGQVSG